MQTLHPGAVVDQYRLIRPIGQGGFGTVWLAHSRILNAHVALKVLNPANPEAVAIELNAVRTYKAMAVAGGSAGLMPIEHVGVIDNQVFYVLPLADGLDDVPPEDPDWQPRTLAACIDQQRQASTWFTPDEITAWLTPICSAAQVLSDAGLVHRDIKPDNILFLRGLPVLSDISLLRTDTLTATRIGTPGYSAPSWYADSGGRLDMFSLAATLFALLTGNSPDKLGRPAFRWPPQGEGSLSPSAHEAWLHFHRVVLRATHEEASELYVTFAAFAADLRREVAPAVTPSGEVQSPKPRYPLYATLAVGALAIAGLGNWFFSRHAPEPQPSQTDSKSFPVLGQPWENTLGMKFVPVPGVIGLFAIWDVRTQDYEEFASVTRRNWSKDPGKQRPNYPAVNVSWNDAQAFCAWLTKTEQAAGRLGPRQKYRLPTDEEWSLAVGLNEPSAGTPKSKDKRVKSVYPWGTQWPPPSGVGNYSSNLKVDNFSGSSPVGAFAANQFGLYDMGGNVRQWCEDFLNGSSGLRVMRGASFSTDEPDSLLLSFRNGGAPDSKLDNLGFRCVIAVGN